MTTAVGTSLLVIGMNSAMGLLGHLGSATLDWALLVPVTVVSAGGFCFGSAEGVTCFGKHNNSATLPAKGEPTSTRDLPATGFEGPMPNSFDIAPGESHTHAGITCTATAAGFDCVNDKTGAAISVAGPEMELTPPMR